MAHGVLLVDDHRLLREGIKIILEQTGEFRVLGEAETGSDAIRLCWQLRPHLVIMDLALRGVNGVEAIAEIMREGSSTRIMILSMHEDDNSVIGAFRAGARAFLSKNGSAADLLDGLRTVSNGGSYLSPRVCDRLLTRIQWATWISKSFPGQWRTSPAESSRFCA